MVTGYGREQFASTGAKIDFMDPGQQELVEHVASEGLRSCWITADQFSCGPCGISFLQSEGFKLWADLLLDSLRSFCKFEKIGVMADQAWSRVY